MARREGHKLLAECSIVDEVVGERAMSSTPDRGGASGKSRPAGERLAVRSVTVNLAESPLGWLFAHGHLSERQFAAGERIRVDWERSCLDPRVTMSWDGAPIARGGGASPGIDLSMAQYDARRRFERATGAAGPGLADIVWRVLCAGEGMRDAERALGWPARAGKLAGESHLEFWG